VGTIHPFLERPLVLGQAQSYWIMAPTCKWLRAVKSFQCRALGVWRVSVYPVLQNSLGHPKQSTCASLTRLRCRQHSAAGPELVLVLQDDRSFEEEVLRAHEGSKGEMNPAHHIGYMAICVTTDALLESTWSLIESWYPRAHVSFLSASSRSASSFRAACNFPSIVHSFLSCNSTNCSSDILRSGTT